MEIKLVLSLIPLTAFLLLLTIAFRIYFSGMKVNGARMFMLFCVAGAYISFVEFQLRIAESSDRAHVWQITTSLWPFAVIFFHHFIAEFLGYKFIKKRYYQILLYLSCMVMVGTFLHYTLTFHPLEGRFGFVLPSPFQMSFFRGGFAAYAATFFPVVNIGLILYWYFFRSEEGKTQKKFLSLLLVLSYAFPGLIQGVSVATDGAVPELTGVQYLFVAVFTFAAIRRYNLFNLNPETAAENLIAEMDDLFFLCHTDGTVVNVNRKTMEVLGVEEDGLAGQPIQECISRDVDLSSDKAITVPIRRKQYAQERIVQFRASPLYSRKGSKIGYIVLGSDITESAERQQQLRAAVEEKSVLLKEVYHRVKNNLQVIISLLDLRSGIIDDPDNKMLLLEEIARIRVISMVHNLIYERDDLRSIQIVPFTRNIIYMVAEIFELPLLDITLDIHLPEIELNMDRGVIFGLIMYEAINNAFKHVFSAGGKGVLRVTGTDENGHIRIVVANNAGDSAPGRNKDTLGITLMEMLSAQIDGSLEVIKPGGGDTGEWSVVIDFAREN